MISSIFQVFSSPFVLHTDSLAGEDGPGLHVPADAMDLLLFIAMEHSVRMPWNG